MSTQPRGPARALARLLAALAALALLAPAAGLAAPARQAPDVAPRVAVAPGAPEAPAGGALTYEIRVRNTGEASRELRRVDVTLTYDPAVVELIDSQLRDRRDWVSSAEPGSVTVRFGAIGKGQGRGAGLVFRVSREAARGTQIQTAARYRWVAPGAEGEGRERIDPVVVAGPLTLAPPVVTPAAGPPGTVFTVSAGGFRPQEQVVTWLNAPGGVQALQLTGRADGSGQVRLQLASGDLAPGAYGLVLHGRESRVQQVAPLTVTAP